MSSYAIDDRQISIALQTHMGLGAVMMGGFSYIFARSYYSTKKEQSRIFKALPLAATFFKLFYYLLSLLIYTTQDPALLHFDPIFLRFFAWFVSIPPILIAIVLLDSTSLPDIICLCTLNSIMIISGYFAHIATHPATVWSFYGFGLGCAFFIARNMFYKYIRIRGKKEQSINNKIYQFLCLYTLIVWNIFPISFIFFKTNIISYEIQSILYVYLDILAKGFLGIILVGARDMMDKKVGRMVRFANAFVHVYTREKSITDGEIVTGESDETFTPPSSLDDLTPAEKDFITGQPPKNHTVISVDPKPQRMSVSKTSIVPMNNTPVTKKLIRSNSSPAHLKRSK